MIRRLAKSVATLVCVAASFVGVRGASGSPPNFVFVLADDMGYGDLGCYGQRRIETPHIDALAAEGVRLTQHYSGSTVCAPSRCAFMTGRHTGHTSVRGNREQQPEGQASFADDVPTLAQRLQAAGYATGAFGKWGLGYPGSGSEPRDLGFDEFFGYNCQRHAHRYYTDYLWDGGRRVDFDPTTYTHTPIYDRGLEFIRANAGQPFFCFLAVAIPHAAMEAPEVERAVWRERFAEFDEVVGEYADSQTANPIASFAAMMTILDRDVGRLSDLLEELGIADNTIVVFTSDNGPHVEGGHDPEFFDSAGGLRGVKRDLYEGGIRVPAIVRWPSRVPAGRTVDHVSANWDWLPTVCDAADVAVDEPIDGLSMVPALTGEGEQAEHPHLYWEFPYRGGRQAIRRGDWKAVRYDVATNPDRRPELYHLPSDPAESTDLSADRPQLADELGALMDASRTPSERFPLAGG